ncbi:MAG: class I SAM-dependent methyltransferase [Brevinematales bacterium]|nr:class I SAM-dependent methyltransferase [Brevinematales bacterium]
MPGKSVVEKFNNERYNNDESMNLKNSMNTLRYNLIVKRIEKIMKTNPVKNPKIIDLGCGPGHLCKSIHEKGFPVIGVDISENSLKLVREKGIPTIKADLQEKLPFKDDELDILVASEVVEHIFDTETFMSELKRVMKPGGSIIITTPNVASLARRFLLFFGKNPYLDYKLSGTAGHVRYFTFKNMRDFARQFGLKVVSLETDAVNLSGSGKLYSRLLGKIFPTFGKTIILQCVK